MAVLNVLVDRRPREVWDVLADGRSYAEWVLGTRNIRDVDPDWPGQGAEIRYAVGIGRWTFEDITTVRLAEPGRRLEVEAHARPSRASPPPPHPTPGGSAPPGCRLCSCRGVRARRW
jgi:hypothetical protein